MAEGVLESLLNFIIPPAVFLLLGWISYTAFKVPIDQMIAKYRNWRENRKGSGGSHSQLVPTIQYE